MAVLKRHSQYPTREEKHHIETVLQKFETRQYPGFLDDRMSTIGSHYHMHLRENKKMNNFPITTVPHKIGGIEAVNSVWRDWVLERRFEGLVITEQKGVYYRITKVKTWFNIDAVILAIDTTGKSWSKGIFGSLYLGLMDKKGRIVEIGKMSGGTERWKSKMRKKLEKDKISTVSGKMYVKPKHVVEVKFLETSPSSTYWDVFKLKKDGTIKQVPLPAEYKAVDPFSIRAGLKFVRDRPDKSVNWRDIRIEQIPEFFGSSGRRMLLAKMKRVDNKGKPLWKKIRGIEDLERL